MEQDLSKLDVTKLHPLSPEVISRQATINIGTDTILFWQCFSVFNQYGEFVWYIGTSYVDCFSLVGFRIMQFTVELFMFTVVDLLVVLYATYIMHSRVLFAWW